MGRIHAVHYRRGPGRKRRQIFRRAIRKGQGNDRKRNFGPGLLETIEAIHAEQGPRQLAAPERDQKDPVLPEHGYGHLPRAGCFKIKILHPRLLGEGKRQKIFGEGKEIFRER